MLALREFTAEALLSEAVDVQAAAQRLKKQRGPDVVVLVWNEEDANTPR